MAKPIPDAPRIRTRPRLRTLEQNLEERHASWLELFFDLVFVLAVSQVAHVLSDHTDAGGLLKYFVLFIPVWYSWVGFTFYADRFESDETLYRILMFAGMLAVSGLAMTLGDAFTGASDVRVVVCYVLVLLVLIALYSRAAYHVPLTRQYCLQFVVGLGVSAVLFSASIFTDSTPRYVVWAIALAIQFAVPFLNISATRFIPLDAKHIPERLGLFTIIVLGEAVISTANGISAVEWSVEPVATAALAFGMAACIWWINFDFVEDNAAITSKALLPRFVNLYGHFFIIASIVAVGVGMEHAIKESASAHLHFSTLALVSGGIAGYLTAVTIVRMATGACHLPYIRVASIGAALLLIFLGPILPPLAIVSGMLLILICGIWVETRYAPERAEPIEPLQLLDCEHHPQMTVYHARTHDGCEECRKNNYKWVHLRLCLSCGHVGCCDTSIHKHATKHFMETSHAIIASLEPGEHWAWCYEDERFVPLHHSVLP